MKHSRYRKPQAYRVRRSCDGYDLDAIDRAADILDAIQNIAAFALVGAVVGLALAVFGS